MSSKKEHNRPKTKIPWLWIGLIIPLLIFTFVKGCQAGSKSKKASKKIPVTQVKVPVGRVDACAKNPTFPIKNGLQPPFLIDLRQISTPGLKIIEAKKDGKVLVLDGWGDEGTLGPYTLDENGVIYTAPIPFVNMHGQSPSHFNKLLSVDAETGKMSEFMHLPAAKPPTNENPYGILGMTYNCSDHSIYVASVAGSNAENEVGRIFHIDAKSKKILHTLDGFDAIGIGIFNMKSGKKMYMGHARSPEIFSIELDESGGFIGEPKFEFSLAALDGGSYDNAHRIRFLRGNIMKIKGIEFSFSLIAASDPQRNIYMFDYDDKNDTWKFREAHPQRR